MKITSKVLKWSTRPGLESKTLTYTARTITTFESYGTDGATGILGIPSRIFKTLALQTGLVISSGLRINIGIIKLAIMPTVPINYTMDATQQYCDSKKFGSFTSCAKSNYIYVVCIWNLHNALMQETYLSHTSTHTWLMDHHATYILVVHISSSGHGTYSQTKNHVFH